MVLADNSAANASRDDVTDQAEAMGVQRLWLFGLSGWHDNTPSPQLCDYLRRTEEDGRVGATAIDLLHQTLLVVSPAGTDSSSPEQVRRRRTNGLRLDLTGSILRTAPAVRKAPPLSYRCHLAVPVRNKPLPHKRTCQADRDVPGSPGQEMTSPV